MRVDVSTGNRYTGSVVGDVSSMRVLIFIRFIRVMMMYYLIFMI